MNELTQIVEMLRGTSLRGAVRLQDGRLGLLFENNVIVACRDARILSRELCTGAIRYAERSTAEQAAVLLSMRPMGPTTARDRLEARRESVHVDPKAPRRTVDLTGVEDAVFVGEDYESVATQSDRSKRDARFDRIERETPEV